MLLPLLLLLPLACQWGREKAGGRGVLGRSGGWGVLLGLSACQWGAGGGGLPDNTEVNRLAAAAAVVVVVVVVVVPCGVLLPCRCLRAQLCFHTSGHALPVAVAVAAAGCHRRPRCCQTARVGWANSPGAWRWRWRGRGPGSQPTPLPLPLLLLLLLPLLLQPAGCMSQRKAGGLAVWGGLSGAGPGSAAKWVGGCLHSLLAVAAMLAALWAGVIG